MLFDLSLKVWIYIIVSIIIFLFAGIVLIVWNWRSIKNTFMKLFNKTNYFKVYFIYANGQTKWTPLSLDENNQFEYKGSIYDFDHDCVKFEKNTPVLHYYDRVPHPINFRKTKSDNVEVIIDGHTYKQVMKAKILKNLVQENQQFFIIMVMMGAMLLVLIILALYQMGFLDQFIGKTPGGA